MSRAAVLITVALTLLGFLLGAMIGFWLDAQNTGDQTGKTVTVEKTVPGPETTVEKTVPGPERTVYKRKPGTTTWIIVCGENTQRVEGSEAKPITECNLPDTGPTPRRHKAH